MQKAFISRKDLVLKLHIVYCMKYNSSNYHKCYEIEPLNSSPNSASFQYEVDANRKQRVKEITAEYFKAFPVNHEIQYFYYSWQLDDTKLYFTINFLIFLCTGTSKNGIYIITSYDFKSKLV